MTMIKRIYILLTIAFIAMYAPAATTTDKLTAEHVVFVLQKDEIQYIEIYLSGNNIYTAHSMEIYLPEELEFAKEDDGSLRTLIDDLCVYPSKRGYPSSHTLSTVYHKDRNMLAVACLSLSSEEFKSTSGRLLYVGIKPKEGTKPCEVKADVRNIHLIDKKATDYTTEDIEVPVIVVLPDPVPTSVGNVETMMAEPTAEYTISGQKASHHAKRKSIHIAKGKKYVK